MLVAGQRELREELREERSGREGRGRLLSPGQWLHAAATGTTAARCFDQDVDRFMLLG